MMLIAVAVLFSCKSQQSTPAKTSSGSDIKNRTQALKDSLEYVKVLDELNDYQDEKERERAIKALKHAHYMDSLKQEKISVPCTKEFLELEKKNCMAAQGVVTGKSSIEDAFVDANHMAIAELTSRWVGVIKNGMERYSKDSRTKSSARLQESQLEDLTINVFEKSINKLMKVACKETQKNKNGGYDCYVAIYVATNDVLDEIEKAIEEEMGLDIDKSIFRQRMQDELDEQSRKRQEETEARLKALEEKSE